MADEKTLYWIASSLKDMKKMPDEMKKVFGQALYYAQKGGKHPDAKPFKGVGSGVMEVVENFDTDTYRAVYTVKFSGVVYALHVFQKKSKAGIKTPKEDVALIKSRLKLANEHYEKLKKDGKI